MVTCKSTREPVSTRDVGLISSHYPLFVPEVLTYFHIIQPSMISYFFWSLYVIGNSVSFFFSIWAWQGHPSGLCLNVTYFYHEIFIRQISV